MAFMGFTPGQIAGLFGDVTESAIRTAKNHPKGLVGGFIGLDLAVSAGNAKKKETGTDLAAAVSGQIGGTIGGIIGGLTPIPGGALIGMTVGDQIARSSTAKVLNKGLRISERATAVNTGGQYKDTDVAFTMRQRSAIEMSGSMLNARHWLGKEANAFHT